MKDITVGFAVCGSFCTLGKVMPQLALAKEEFETVIPIFSEAVAQTDSRFGSAQGFFSEAERICGCRPLTKITEVEPIGPKKLLDLLIVAPCTGNTLGKLASGITDSVVTMAVKAQLRNQHSVLLAVSTNDGLGASGKNIMELMNRPNIYFVPFGQDDPEGKPTSLVADMTKILPAAHCALEGKQLQPVLI